MKPIDRQAVLKEYMELIKPLKTADPRPEAPKRSRVSNAEYRNYEWALIKRKHALTMLTMWPEALGLVWGRWLPASQRSTEVTVYCDDWSSHKPVIIDASNGDQVTLQSATLFLHRPILWEVAKDWLFQMGAWGDYRERESA